MKVLSSAQLREADQFTLQNEPISSIDLMERASNACVNKLLELFPNNSIYSIYCGTGNNGGDGLAIARILSNHGYSVSVAVIQFSPELSNDNALNLERLKNMGIAVQQVNSAEQLEPVISNTIILDALVGTGLSRPLTGLLLDTVTFLNKQECSRVAIDIPSGMFCDLDCENNLEGIFKADFTLSFEVPKLNFLLPSLYPFVGRWILLDIGLNKAFIEEMNSPYFLTDLDLISKIIKTRSPFAHKGSFGHGLIIAGSYGKMGAAVLASKACLKAGAGLVSVFIPSCGYDILQSTVPEVMVHCSTSVKELSESLDYTPYTAIGVGPGIGQSKATKRMLETLLTKVSSPMVIDADALNLLGEHKDLLQQIPKNAIVTPHLKEFERVFGTSDSCFERLQRQREVSMKNKLYILLKGKNTSISCPDGSVFFNNTGNPGMATAGSGDVLTGIITGLLCQGYTPKDSAVLGCYIHGLSGDITLQSSSEEALVASDLFNNLGAAFRLVKNRV